MSYAEVDRQTLISLEIPEGSSIECAIDRSGILILYPTIDLSQQKVGIFGNQKKLTDILQEGDRVEIYRPLNIDPKSARRKRAAGKREI